MTTPHIPRRLQPVIRRNSGKYHRIAAELRVNPYHVFQFLTKGKEPSNPEIRERMMLPKKTRKPKRTQPATPDKQQERDLFGTPAYATDLIAPFLYGMTIWEPAAGQGRITERLKHHGLFVASSDIQTGTNFLDCVECTYDAIVTNPPYSLKRQFYERCKAIGKPFALLIPADFCGWTIQALRDGCQWIIPTRRIDYITPTGKSGKESTAQFHSGWLTYGLKLPNQINIVELTLEMKRSNL